MAASTPLQGYIPIRPDHLRFVQWRENLQEPNTALRLPGQGAICNYLTDLIQFGRSIYLPAFATEREPLELPCLTARLYFTASPGFLDHTFFEYADLVAYYFDQFLHNHWKEEVDRWTAAVLYCEPRTDRKDAIAELHRISGMEHFREVEADIKANYRIRDYRNVVRRKMAK